MSYILKNILLMLSDQNGLHFNITYQRQDK